MKYKPLYFFTDPYEDELIYSAISRFLFYFSQISVEERMNMLFGKPVGYPSLFFVNNPEYLVNQLGDGYTVESIIWNNTLYPYFAPFISSDRQDYFLNNPSFCNNLKLSYSGLSSKTFKNRYHILRFCPSCVKEDLKRYGETYHHRRWNLPGIDVCPIHHVYLERYPINTWESYSRYIYADASLLEIPALPCTDTKEIALAQSASTLLELHDLSLNKKIIVEKLIDLLKSKGLYNNRGIERQKFYEAMIDYYGIDFLLDKSCFDLNDQYNKKIFHRLVDRTPAGTIPPHLFLMTVNMLCNDFNTFINTKNFTKPLSRKWICRNKVCSNYRKPVDNYTLIKDGTRQRILVRCSECGMVYSYSPNNSNSFRIYQTGQKLFDRVNELKEKGYSKRQLIQELELPRSMVDSIWQKDYNPTILDDKINEARKCLTNELKANPHLTRTEFQNYHKPEYRILYYYDNSWFNRILPYKKGTPYPKLLKSEEDSYNLDMKYLVKAQEAYQSLLKLEPLIRISKKRILNFIGLTFSELKRLPETDKFIKKVVEDKTKYNLRKGKYWIDWLVENGGHFNKKFLQNHKVSGLSNPELFDKLVNYYNISVNKYS